MRAYQSRNKGAALTPCCSSAACPPWPLLGIVPAGEVLHGSQREVIDTLRVAQDTATVRSLAGAMCPNCLGQSTKHVLLCMDS